MPPLLLPPHDDDLRGFPLHLIRVSNRLIELGKAEGPRLLRNYVMHKRSLDYDYDETQMFYVCKMIYTHTPEVRKRQRLPLPQRFPLGVSCLTEEQENSFPDFPLLIANYVPFLIIRGFDHAYGLPGKAGDVLAYLNFCELELEYKTVLEICPVSPDTDIGLRIKNASLIAIAAINSNPTLNSEDKDAMTQVILDQMEAPGEN